MLYVQDGRSSYLRGITLNMDSCFLMHDDDDDDDDDGDVCLCHFTFESV
jgi:hypothetical protein